MLGLLFARLEEERKYVGEIGTAWLLVHWTHVVALEVLGLVDGVDPGHGQISEEHLGRRLRQAAETLVPAGAVQVQAVNVDALGRRRRDVLLHLGGDLVVEEDGVERPLLVARDLLLHGGEEALRVEEAREPEAVRLAVEQPRVKLSIAIDQVREPEAECGRLPRDSLK